MPKKQNKIEDKKYVVTLVLKSGEIIKGEGDTALEAMQKIEVEPKTMGLLSIDFQGKHVERQLNGSRLKRMFSPKAGPFIKKIALSTYSKFLISGLC